MTRATQILGFTADNASNNDTFVDELEKIAKQKKWTAWRGNQSRARCFLHVLNLVAQAILRQFDPPHKKKKAGDAAPDSPDEVDNADEAELFKELAEMGAGGYAQEVPAADGDDDLDGYDDVVAGMEPAERACARADVKPVRLALAKVRRRSKRVGVKR